eukprot:4279735-Prymnesium_polylepis.1
MRIASNSARASRATRTHTPLPCMRRVGRRSPGWRRAVAAPASSTAGSGLRASRTRRAPNCGTAPFGSPPRPGRGTAAVSPCGSRALSGGECARGTAS